MDKAQFLQRSQGLRRHSERKKGPKTTLSWSCFVSAAIVVLKSLCGQDCREKAKGVTFLQSHAVAFQSDGFWGWGRTSSTSGVSQPNREADKVPSHHMHSPAPHSPSLSATSEFPEGTCTPSAEPKASPPPRTQRVLDELEPASPIHPHRAAGHCHSGQSTQIQISPCRGPERTRRKVQDWEMFLGKESRAGDQDFLGVGSRAMMTQGSSLPRQSPGDPVKVQALTMQIRVGPETAFLTSPQGMGSTEGLGKRHIMADPESAGRMPMEAMAEALGESWRGLRAWPGPQALSVSFSRGQPLLIVFTL